MKKIIFGILILGFGFSVSAKAATYYVSPSGSGSNPGTLTSPKSLGGAASIVNPGDTVILLDGTYPPIAGDATIIPARSGTSSAWITFKAQNKWMAKLNGSNNTGKQGVYFSSNISYIKVQDIEIYGFSYAAVEVAHNTNTHIEISGNHIHDNARVCLGGNVNNGYGIIMIWSDSITIDRNVIHDTGRYGVSEGCNPSGGNYPQNDHAVYVSGASHVTVTNNIFYKNKSGWDLHVYHHQDSIIPTNLIVANNTFATQGNFHGGPGQIILAKTGLTDGKIFNNIFYKPQGGGAVFLANDGPVFNNVLVSHNITYGGVINSGTRSGVTFDTSNIDNTDPKLTNPASPNLVDPTTHDFYPLSGSPAINAGMVVAQVTDDFDGNARPFGTAFDIGAYEFGGTTPPAFVYHPADTNPQDKIITLNEATSFGACWRSNCKPGATLENAVRAGYLWNASATGDYHYLGGNCPACWEVGP